MTIVREAYRGSDVKPKGELEMKTTRQTLKMILAGTACFVGLYTPVYAINVPLLSDEQRAHATGIFHTAFGAATKARDVITASSVDPMTPDGWKTIFLSGFTLGHNEGSQAGGSGSLSSPDAEALKLYVKVFKTPAKMNAWGDRQDTKVQKANAALADLTNVVQTVLKTNDVSRSGLQAAVDAIVPTKSQVHVMIESELAGMSESEISRYLTMTKNHWMDEAKRLKSELEVGSTLKGQDAVRARQRTYSAAGGHTSKEQHDALARITDTDSAVAMTDDREDRETMVDTLAAFDLDIRKGDGDGAKLSAKRAYEATLVDNAKKAILGNNTHVEPDSDLKVPGQVLGDVLTTKDAYDILTR